MPSSFILAEAADSASFAYSIPAENVEISKSKLVATEYVKNVCACFAVCLAVVALMLNFIIIPKPFICIQSR
jgi:hypothetical protein